MHLPTTPFLTLTLTLLTLSPTRTHAYTGQLTYYTPGLGSCGLTSNPTDDIVALSVAFMQNPPNPNANPLCGRTIRISYGGQTHDARVVDTCEACAWGDVDASPGLFGKVAPGGDGRVGGVGWEFV